MDILYIIIALLISYLLGSIPFGLIIAKRLKNIDIRQHGSANVGATNVARVLGFKWGLLVFILDALKGALPIVLIVYAFRLTNLYMFWGINFSIIYGLAAAFGHMCSVFLKFKGGKAVATACGIVIALNPIIGAIVIGFYVLVLFAFKYSSVASLSACVLALICFYLDIFLFQWWLPGGWHEQIINLCTLTGLVILIFYLHRKNIVRLFNGTESKFGKKNKIVDDTDAKDAN